MIKNVERPTKCIIFCAYPSTCFFFLLLFQSVLNAYIPLLAVKGILCLNYTRKSPKPQCHMFNAIERTLACVNLGVLYCMHLGGMSGCAILSIHYLSLSCSTEK